MVGPSPLTRRAALKATAASLASGLLAGCSASGSGNTTTGAPSVDETVLVGPDQEFVFRPGTEEALSLQPGTTVEFVWKSDTHNVVVESQPDDADWKGSPGGAGDTYDTGYSFAHTFEVVGRYEYVCKPHEAIGMKGAVVVEEA